MLMCFQNTFFSSDNQLQEVPLHQDINKMEMNTVEDLRRKLESLEKINLELNNQHYKEMSRYEKEILQLRLELEKGELLRQNLENEMKFARKEANLQLYSAEDELCDAKNKVMELQGNFQKIKKSWPEDTPVPIINDRHQQKASEIDKIAQSDQFHLQQEQQRCAVEKDNIHRVHLAELEFLIREKAEAEMAFQV
uniref:CC171 protein n=1 Tax=Junco hyemalis TaxID=40217 RepID=A0A8C5ICW2_JUNHY